MRRWKWMCAWILPMMCVVPTGAAAQDGLPGDVLQRPSRSLALSVGGGMEIGYWTRLSDRTDLGLEIGARGHWTDADDDERDQISVSLGPALKRYMGTRGPLAPYGFMGVKAGFARVRFTPPERKQRTYSLTAQGGVGLDWFPARGVSLGGHVGIAAGYGANRDEFADFTGAPEVRESDNIFAQTFNSGLRVHLYF